jgi:acyl carrier protein
VVTSGEATGRGQRDVAQDDATAGILAGLREILARVTGREELLRASADAPLLGEGAGLDSLSGTLLLREVYRRYGVDVADEDLNLDSLATLATLTAFLAARRPA